MQWARRQSGFTIVELLIVVVVIAILAAITIVSYNGITAQAQMSKIQNDLTQFEKAVMAARNSTGLTFGAVAGSYYTAGNCVSKSAGTDLAALPSNDPCWVRYSDTLSAISSASGMDIRSLKDPWGRPYFIDENEGEGGTACNTDSIGVYARPFNGTTRMAGTGRSIPLSGNSGC